MSVAPRSPSPSSTRPASRRTASSARPASETAKPSAKVSGQAAEPSSRRPVSGRVESAPAKRPVKLYAAVGVAVLAVIAGVGYRPVMRMIKLNALDKAETAVAVAAADDYVRFEGNDATLIADAVRTHRGPFAAQVRMANAIQSFALLMTIAEQPALTPAQRTAALSAGLSIFNAERHRAVALPAALPSWAEQSDDAALALSAMAVAVAVAHGAANLDVDKEGAALASLLVRIATKPEQDAQRVAAALDGLAKVATEANLDQILALLAGPLSEQVIAHAALTAQIISLARAPHLPAVIGLLDHPRAPVRALALETLGGVSLAAAANPKTRTQLAQRISAKLISATPAIELAAALKATAGLRLTSAGEAVLALLPARAQLALPGIAETWWAECLGRSLILTQPDTARPASEVLITKIAAALSVTESRPVVAKALSLITDANFVQLRPALDRLAEFGATPECITALTTLVAKTYLRSDIASVCGNDLVKWRGFLAKDRPRSLRATEIRTYVDTHQDQQRVSVGRDKLMAARDYLDLAGKDLQGWCDDKTFIPPLGLSKTTIENLLHDVKLLHFGVTKAMPALP